MIDVIVKDTSTDKLRKQADLLDKIHNFSRGRSQKPSDYVVASNSALHRYIKDSGTTDEKTSEPFATLMMKNAHLPADTLNTVIFQLSSPSFARKSAIQIIKVQKSEDQYIIRIISQNQPVDEENHKIEGYYRETDYFRQ